MAHIISISSLKGGVGKTSVTLGIASAALAKGLNTIVIDLDPHGDSSTGLNVPQNGTDIGTMLQSPQDFDFLAELVPSAWNDIAMHRSGDTTTGNIAVARGSAASTILERLSEEDALPRLDQLLGKETRELADLIIIDCPPTLGRISSMVWAVSDQVISVAEPSLFSVAGTERTLRALERFSQRTDYTAGDSVVILNKVRAEDPEHNYRIEEMQTLFGDLVAPQQLPDFPQYQRIVGASYPVHFWPEESAKDFAKNFSDILDTLLVRESK